MQIGNYVMINKIPRRVEAITNQKIGYYKTGEGVMQYARKEDIEPIVVNEFFVKDDYTIVLNRTFFLSGDLWAAGRADKVCVETPIGDISFCTPIYLHDMHNAIKAMSDTLATIEMVPGQIYEF